MELTVTLSYKVLVEQTKTLRVHLSLQKMSGNGDMRTESGCDSFTF